MKSLDQVLEFFNSKGFIIKNSSTEERRYGKYKVRLNHSTIFFESVNGLIEDLKTLGVTK